LSELLKTPRRKKNHVTTRSKKHGWGTGETHTEFQRRNLREGHLKEPGVNGRIIVKCIFEKWDGGKDWIDRAQDRDRWRAVVNAVMSSRVHKMREFLQ
jgi:hypothetical protein